MDPFAADLAEILDETKQFAEISQDGISRRVRVAINALTSDGAGYSPIDGETVSTSATILRADLPFQIRLDATLAVSGKTYRVTGVTETVGDPAVTLTLAIEGAAL